MNYISEMERISEIASVCPERARLAYQCLILSPSAAVELSIEKSPPYPSGSGLPGLFLYLRDLPASSRSDVERVAFSFSCSELLLGLSHMVKAEWDSSYKFNWDFIGGKFKGITKAQEVCKPCGRWLQALLHLCEKTITYAEASGQPYSISAFELFRNIVEEVASIGGISETLLLLYEKPVEEPVEEPLKNAWTKKRMTRTLRAASTELQSKKETQKKEGYIAALIDKSIDIAGKNNKFNRSVFRAFTQSTTAYVNSLNGPNCGVLLMDYDKELSLTGLTERSKDGRKKKTSAVPFALKGFHKNRPDLV